MAVELLSGTDATIVPSRDCVLSAEAGKVLFEFVAEVLICVRARHEDVGHGPCTFLMALYRINHTGWWRANCP